MSNTTTVTKPEVTFEKLCEVAGHILRPLEYCAKHISSQGNPEFCANNIFYGVFKPIICDTVGWDALWEVRSFGERVIIGSEIGNIDRTKKTPHYCHTEEQRAMMRSEAAYNAVYERIYRLLPDCRGEHFG